MLAKENEVSSYHNIYQHNMVQHYFLMPTIFETLTKSFFVDDTFVTDSILDLYNLNQETYFW